VVIMFVRADGVAGWDGRLAMGDALDITVRGERGVVIAAVAGDVDISTVAQLRECLFELADSGETLIVDLNRVAFIDSAGLGALVGTSRRAAEHGGSLLAVCALSCTLVFALTIKQFLLINGPINTAVILSLTGVTFWFVPRALRQAMARQTGGSEAA